MNTEMVFIGHDNSIDLVLKNRIAGASDFAAVDLAGVTQMTLTVGSVLVSSTNQVADAIRWIQPGYVTGEIRMTLGDLALASGAYQAPLVVYDAAHSDGIVWGYVPLRVFAEVEIV